MREHILEIMEKKGSLPSFPEIILKIQEIVNDPDAGIIDVVDLIKMDPVLTGTVIKAASSALYGTGFSGEKTLLSAVHRLGINNIRQIVYSAELSKLFTSSRIINPKDFWRHSVTAAGLTRQLSHYIEVSEQTQEKAYFAGLMHDIGIMVFSYVIPVQYMNFLKSSVDKEKPLYVLEKETFQIDHPELGAIFVGKHWGLDEDIINSILYHHFPFRGTPEDIKCGQLVNVANGMCNIHGITNGINLYQDLFSEGAWEGLGLSLSDAEMMIKDINLSVDQTSHMLSF